MANSACKTPVNDDKIEQAEKVRQHQPGPNHSPNKGGSGMADNSPYNSRDGGCNPEKTNNWRSIGELAAALVRKAGGA